MFHLLRPCLVLFLGLTLITGVAYPLAVTGVAQVVFPHQANGSLIVRGDKVVGSELIGQPFSAAKYFWSRPSATGPFAYNAGASGGSNQGPLNPALAEAVKGRVEALRAQEAGEAPVPVDLVTASGSGLDPHISPAAAAFQVARVARERKLSESEVGNLVQKHTAPRSLGLFGESRVNVLQLNLELDQVTSPKP